MSMFDPTAPLDQVIISDRNRTPILQIITWLCLITSLLAFLTHAGIKLYVFRALKIESWCVLVSLMFCIGQSIAVISQCENGYGTPFEDLNEDKIRENFKAEYSATILLLLSLGFSKFAIGAFIHNLTPSNLHRRINYGIGLVVAIWLVFAVCVSAFQCKVPDMWDRRGQCTDRFAWWNGVAIWNILTEIAIVALELGITARLHVARGRKAAVMSLFACRFLVLIAACIQLYFFHLEYPLNDFTLDPWRSTVLNQILQCLAIVTTCLPYTKIFMEGFESGLMRLDDLRRRGEHTSSNKSYNNYASHGSKSKGSRSRSGSRGWTKGSGKDNREYQLMDMGRSRSNRVENSSGKAGNGDERITRDGVRRTRQRDMEIQVKQTWAVEVQPAGFERDGDASDDSSTRGLRNDGVECETMVQGRAR